MLAFWGLHFDHTWDLTAAGTLALALATFVSLFFEPPGCEDGIVQRSWA